MEMKHFSKINRERCESPKGFNHTLESWSLSDWMTAILGELGEAANIAKKLNRVRDGISGNKETEQELLQMAIAELRQRYMSSAPEAIVPFEPVAFEEPTDTGPYELVGRHGSLTGPEMLVPLLVARK